MESPTKYGLCQACNERLRNEVLTQLDTIKDIVEQLKTVPDDLAGCEATLQKAEEGLKTVDSLESARGKYPFFKSSTEEYVNQLETSRDAIKEKLKSFDLTKASKSVSAVEQPHEIQTPDGTNVETANFENPVTARPPIKAKEPFYKNSGFLAVVITIIVIPAMLLYIFLKPNLGITVDEFKETFNSTMESLDREIRIVFVDWEEGEKSATGYISDKLAFVYSLNGYTRKIESLDFLVSGDNDLDVLIDSILCLNVTINTVDPNIKLSDSGKMAMEMHKEVINGEGDYKIVKGGIEYKLTQNSETGTIILSISPEE